MQHFFINQNLSVGELLIDDVMLIHQLKTVLRFRVGDRFMILDGRGGKAVAEILEISRKSVKVLVSDVQVFKMPDRKVRLFVALSKKPATFEMILQKATELGVTDVIPLVTQYCQVRELRKIDRLKLIVKEAAEQSERIFLPVLHDVKTLENVLADKISGKILAGSPRNFDCKISEIKISDDEDVNLIVGPEGGLSAEEEEMIKAYGGLLFTMGENILRMETAAIAALSVILLRNLR